MKVLVAEDDPDIQVILKMVLTRLGKCDVTVTDQGDQVVPLVKTQKPGLVLLDVMLPELNGTEICKLLKSNPETASIPVIFLTARSMPAEAQRALDGGALGYLAKPFDPMALVGQINELLAPKGIALGT